MPPQNELSQKDGAEKGRTIRSRESSWTLDILAETSPILENSQRLPCISMQPYFDRS